MSKDIKERYSDEHLEEFRVIEEAKIEKAKADIILNDSNYNEKLR
jgi:hypothetical protein